jgi:hypothetical protein
MKAGAVGAWIRWAIFGAIAIWTIVLFVLSKDSIEINDGNQKILQLENELVDTKRLVALLQSEKEKLQKLSDEQGYLLLKKG